MTLWLDLDFNVGLSDLPQQDHIVLSDSTGVLCLCCVVC